MSHWELEKTMKSLIHCTLIAALASVLPAVAADRRPDADPFQVTFPADALASPALRVDGSEPRTLEASRTLYRGEEVISESRVLLAPSDWRSGTLELPFEQLNAPSLADGDYAVVIEVRENPEGAETAFISTITAAFRVDAGRIAVTSTEAAWGWQLVNGPGEDSVIGTPNEADVLAALPNLRLEVITHQATCGIDGLCTVKFYNTVCNRGTATAWSFGVAMKGWGTPTISS